MYQEVGSYDAKTRLPELLRRVAAGERFTITRHGKPVADMVPSQRTRPRVIGQAIDGILEQLREGKKFGELSEGQSDTFIRRLEALPISADPDTVREAIFLFALADL